MIKTTSVLLMLLTTISFAGPVKEPSRDLVQLQGGNSELLEAIDDLERANSEADVLEHARQSPDPVPASAPEKEEAAPAPIASSPAIDSINSEIVRVRLMRLTLPLQIEASLLQANGVSKDAYQKAAYSQNDKVTIDRKWVGGQPVWILKKGEIVTRLSDPVLELKSQGKIKMGRYELPSPLLLSSKQASRGVDIIAALKLDDYLEGVLGGEMPASWPLEALKAQAVAARTYTLYQMQTHAKDPYQLEGSVLDQVYSSIPSPQKDKIKTAVESTQGMVLVQNSRVIKAYYHSDCGGQTEDPSSIWGGGTARKTRPIIDEHCALSSVGRWSLEISLDELKSKLDSLRDTLKDIRDVRIVSRTPSQRAALLAFNDGDHEVMISGNDLRRALGYNKLKSTLFTISQKAGALVFKGRGFGHGSGLCQWGARFMAEQGAKANQILNHYYPGARLSEWHVANR